MTITPWRWETSNGSATAAQTHAAYAALVSNGNTSLFHRNVWNDLVNKVNEVLGAMNLAWANTYGSVNVTKMTQLYETLTAARFNALRYNTRYNSWSWAVNPSIPGYVGRDSFIGIGSAGENDADVVYGRYFLELAERLNVVIGIINGTTPTKDMDLTLISSLLPEVGLFSGASAAIEVAEAGNIIPTAVMQSENLPSWTMHILVPSPLAHAALETDEISSRLVGYIFMTCSVGNRRLIRLPPVPISALIPSGVSSQSFLRTILSLGFNAAASGTTETLGEINTAGAKILGGFAHSVHMVTGSGVSLPMINPGWCHTRINLDIHNALVAEMVREFVSLTASKLTPTPALMTRPPRVFSSGTELFSGAYPNIETTSPLGIITENIINSPTVLATVGTAQFIKDFMVSESLKSPTFVAKVELDHISTLLGAYLNMLTSGEGVLEKIEPALFVQATEILLPTTSEMTSAFAPIMDYAINIILSQQVEGHTAVAGILSRYTGISLDIQGDGKACTASILQTEVLQNNLEITDTLTSGKSSPTAARIRAAHTATGAANIAQSISAGADSLLFFSPETAAELSALHGMRELLAGAEFSHFLGGDIEMLTNVIPALATAGIDLSQTSKLGHVFYVDLAALISMGVSIMSEPDTEGGWGWQYPTYDEGKITVYQVYLTVGDSSHLFLDPLVSLTKVDISHAIYGTPDYYITAPTAGEHNYGVNITSSLNFFDRTLWERPFQSDDDLYIRQALEVRQKQTYKLEVI
ncbi:MAG TPA: hypothetical protein P5092_20475 [Ruminococcus sp.]|nr:hypothetical protein [Ruminococcus sp.]